MATCKVLLLLDGSDSHPKKWSFKAADIRLPDVATNLRDHLPELVRQRYWIRIFYIDPDFGMELEVETDEDLRQCCEN